MIPFEHMHPLELAVTFLHRPGRAVYIHTHNTLPMDYVLAAFNFNILMHKRSQFINRGERKEGIFRLAQKPSKND
jgi:hypothetical protein